MQWRIQGRCPGGAREGVFVDYRTVGMRAQHKRTRLRDCASSFTSKILSRPSRGQGILKSMGVGGVGENGVHVGLSEFLAQNTAK